MWFEPQHVRSVTPEPSAAIETMWLEKAVGWLSSAAIRLPSGDHTGSKNDIVVPVGEICDSLLPSASMTQMLATWALESFLTTASLAPSGDQATDV